MSLVFFGILVPAEVVVSCVVLATTSSPCFAFFASMDFERVAFKVAVCAVLALAAWLPMEVDWLVAADCEAVASVPGFAVGSTVPVAEPLAEPLVCANAATEK